VSTYAVVLSIIDKENSRVKYWRKQNTNEPAKTGGEHMCSGSVSVSAQLVVPVVQLLL
jgi:hypothetical protein